MENWKQIKVNTHRCKFSDNNEPMYPVEYWNTGRFTVDGISSEELEFGKRVTYIGLKNAEKPFVFNLNVSFGYIQA
jgi:hypothetical protein